MYKKITQLAFAILANSTSVDSVNLRLKIPQNKNKQTKRPVLAVYGAFSSLLANKKKL